MSWIEVAKQKLTTEQVLEHYLGEPNRTKKYRCPFHQDKTPSLSIDTRTGRFRCFSCGAHGDMIDFVQQYHEVSTQKEALEILDRDFCLGLSDLQEDKVAVKEAIRKREEEAKYQKELKARVDEQIRTIRLVQRITREGLQRLQPKPCEPMEAFMKNEKRVNACLWFYFQNAWVNWLEDCLTDYRYDECLDECNFHFELYALGENPMMFTVNQPKENFIRRKITVLEKLEKGEFEPICKRNIMT